MGPSPRGGELWQLRSHDGARLLDVYVIGRSRRQPELVLLAPLAEAASRYDVSSGSGQAIAVWCFIWVEVAQLVERIGALSQDVRDEVFAVYRFLATGEGQEPEGPDLDQDVARDLIERTRGFVWRGPPESWAL